ncbi:FAD-dependent oxidoreductase [Pseudomonas sp. LRF_L74]|uniref:FAD-dependent oxidoreductase n=1 Tax=Pseudomonas sp. LRF_L74 TaxID=3369422 RepID=UPI003F5D85E2
MSEQPTAKIDVLVCGGGMAGTMAAIASARSGARTLLMERYGFLGGSATAASVGQFNSWETAAGRPVIGGLARELVGRLEQAGGSCGHTRWTMSTGHRMDRVEYSPETLKVVLDEMIVEAGVEVLFHAVLARVSAESGVVTQVQALTKGGLLHFEPKVVIDASGDLELLRSAGATFLGLGENETLQPATLMFRFGPIDFAQYEAIPADQLAALAREGVATGLLPRAALHVSRIPRSSDGWFNISRLAVDATDPFSLSQAEIEGRRQAVRAARFITSRVPGCGAGELVAFAPQVGVRETRRVQGDYVITAADLRAARPFDDVVALGAYPIDIHPATGSELIFEELGEDHAYPLPLRSLLPQGLANVLAAGRGISASHEAHAAIRVMPIGMALGQAAGTAAALAARTDGDVRAVSVTELQTRLRESGAILS